VDLDSRLPLLRCEQQPQLDVEPIFSDELWRDLGQIVDERRERSRLAGSGLEPSRSALFTGPPGVGKTLAARWLARELQLPLLTLDLSAVMSSYLGRTGNNLRHVLDYAKDVETVLLLDELDSIAKRRDDSGEVGELKRLVTVLLQEIDDWSSAGLLVAATNHANLLDPAVWRRFDVVVEFPLPEGAAVEQAVRTFLGGSAEFAAWVPALSLALRGSSFSDIELSLVKARRAMLVSSHPESDHLGGIIMRRVRELRREERAQLAADLVASNALSQRQARQVTGVSRDTIRRLIRQRNGRQQQ